MEIHFNPSSKLFRGLLHGSARTARVGARHVGSRKLGEIIDLVKFAVAHAWQNLEKLRVRIQSYFCSRVHVSEERYGQLIRGI